MKFRNPIPFATLCLCVWLIIDGLLLVQVMPGQAIAQVMLSPGFDTASETDDRRKDADSQSEPETVAVILRGQRSPDPMLRYRFWPAPEQRRERSAMVAVNRALLLVSQVAPKHKRHFQQSYDDWAQAPFSALTDGKAKEALQPFRSAVRVLRTGENWMDLRYDLGMQEMTPQQKIETVLPEYQEMRELARLLCIQARVAVAERRWDDAIADLRLGFRLSEVASHGTDTLVSRLIGIAIAGVMMDTVEAMIQQPDCPNLYWALASIPVDRLFEAREALEYESSWVNHLGAVAGIDPLPAEPIGREQAVAQLSQIAKAYAEGFQDAPLSPGETTLSQLSFGLSISMMVGQARQLLSTNPDWRDRMDELSDAEIVLRASDFELQRIRDKWLAWSLMPAELWQASAKHRKEAIESTANPLTLGGKLARTMLPAVDTFALIGMEAKQKHHRLVTLEALRMHAAQAGRLPQTLDSLSPVPAWQDPLSRKPFEYDFQDDSHATLKKRAGRKSDEILVTDLRLEVGR